MTTTDNESPNQCGSVKPTALATISPKYQGQNMEIHRAWMRAEAAMLEALRQGLPITTGFLDPPDMVHHGGGKYLPRRPAAITWTFLTTEEGCDESWSHIVSASGQYGPIIHPSEPDMTLDDTETAENDLDSRIDHLLSAIQAEWEIAIYRTPDGLGVITWDRQSHGNHPAIVVDQDRNVRTYYELPANLRAGYRKAETTPQTLVREAAEAADWYEGIHSQSQDYLTIQTQGKEKYRRAQSGETKTQSATPKEKDTNETNTFPRKNFQSPNGSRCRCQGASPAPRMRA